jgi:glycerophosphoryl diester phosphodiesterase
MQLLVTAGAVPFVSAHRGFSARAPENTLAALERAAAAGATVAEIDVQLTRDSHLVLMHDLTVDRTTDGKGRVADLTLAQIRPLDAGRWFGRDFVGERVPTLDEALQCCAGRMGLLVELKTLEHRDPRIVDAVIRAVAANDARDRAVIASFDHPTLASIHRRAPDLALEMIHHCHLVDTVHAARDCGALLVSVEPEYCVADDVAALHAAGIAVLTTVLSEEHGRELCAQGLDFLESDNVELAVRAASQGAMRRSA